MGQDRVVRLLQRWALAAEAYWDEVKGQASLGSYGPGYLHWGVQANWNYVAALATLAVQAGMSDKARWQSRALAALRFALATHVTGGRPGNDGKLWGHSWISVLGIERAMHGLACLGEALPEEDRAALRRVLVSEADWLLLHATRGASKGVAAGLWASGGCNNPESNVWSGCLLWRVAGMFPDEARAADWRERAQSYLMNGVSVEADAADGTPVAGRPVSAWHVGANFFPHYALDHHGYLNVGYMVICASNAAMLHFDLKRAGLPQSPSLYHHQADLWRVLVRMIFGDGRLARIGGDSRVRYAYCQEYLLPVLLFAADYLRDEHALQRVEQQLTLIEREAEGGGGLFYGRRLEELRRTNPHYYTRLESDRACVLAMLLNYLPLVSVPATPSLPFDEAMAGGWMEEVHGAALHRSVRRFSSFAWRAYGLTQAMCLPPGDSSLAEWTSNLCPVVRFLGDDGTQPGKHRRLLGNRLSSFEGGFVTCGAVMEGVNVPVDEGASCTDQAVTHIAFAALPDGQTCVGLHYVVAAADRVGYIVELKDLHWVVPNDVFNGYRRSLWTVAGQTVLQSPPEHSAVLAFESAWINIDDRLGVVILRGAGEIHVERSATRRAGRYRSLFVEEVCVQAHSGARRCRKGEILSDLGFAVLADATAEATASVRGGALSFPHPGLRGVWVDGSDGQRYALVANFSTGAQVVDVFGETVEVEGGMAVVRGAKTAPSVS